MTTRQLQQYQQCPAASSTILNSFDSRYYEAFPSMPDAFTETSSTTATAQQQQQQQPGVNYPKTIGVTGTRLTLTRYLNQKIKENPELRDLGSLLQAVKMACKTVSGVITRAEFNKDATQQQYDYNQNNGGSSAASAAVDGRYRSMKRLDQLSTLVFQNALRYTGKCAVVAPAISLQDDDNDDLADENAGPEWTVMDQEEHQPGVLICQSLDSNYVACLDPLDGSGNADANICTGTIFGVFDQTNVATTTNHDNDDEDRSLLQPAQSMRAAGYCLYSSSTVFVFTLGDHLVQGFTLDPTLNEFVLSHANIQIPARGSIYSVNEANSEGWDANFKEYLRRLKTGTGQTQQRYAHRYVGSLVGDMHRTLLYGGMFAYPADQPLHPHGNLQLLYKSAPMAFLVYHAGGRAINQHGTDLLQIQPERIHQKSPCFMGSPEDVQELESYLVPTKQQQQDTNGKATKGVDDNNNN